MALELLEEERVSTSGDDNVLHLLCAVCYPDDYPEISLCGKDVTQDEVWLTWTPDQVCAMCAMVLQENNGTCSEGHVQ